jgi:hypothetical protein
MLLVTVVSGEGLLHAIAPPGFVKALLLLKEQLVIFGADFSSEIAPPLKAALLLSKVQLTINGSAVSNAIAPPFCSDVLSIKSQLVMIGLEFGAP